jgi:PIN domain nuclease of toxin-antitoxin system
MESRLSIDTHIVLWLFTGTYQNISTKGKEYLAKCNLCISPMVELELQLLYEIGRTKYTAPQIIQTVDEEIGLSIIDISFKDTIQNSLALNWTRDPFDRLIVATSLATQVPLLTKDRNILTNFDLAVW